MEDCYLKEFFHIRVLFQKDLFFGILATTILIIFLVHSFKRFQTENIKNKDLLLFLGLFLVYVIPYSDIFITKFAPLFPVILGIPLSYYLFNYKTSLKPFYARLCLILTFTKLQSIAISISEGLLCLYLIISYLGLAFKKEALHSEKKKWLAGTLLIFFLCIFRISEPNNIL